MKLLEYEAKNLLSNYDIPTPQSVLIADSVIPIISLPVVVKSQVPVGGRGKAGGVVVITSNEKIEPTIQKILQLSIKGFLPRVLLAEEKLSIDKEYYLSILVDRADQQMKFVANKRGGIEVEDNHSDSFLKIIVDSHSNFEAIGQQLADYFSLPGQVFALQDLSQKLYDCFVKNDALLIEINPLVLTTEQKLVAGDCKMTLDDAASFRHDWQFEEKPAEANFVTLDPNGTIATIANGAGLAMATVDAASDYGLKPANFLDIGGGANTETLLIAFRRLATYPQLKAIVINIFAGITRCDEVAKAIVTAKKQINNLPPLFIRLAGTGYDEAVTILDVEHIPLLPNLEECIAAASKEVRRG